MQTPGQAPYPSLSHAPAASSEEGGTYPLLLSAQPSQQQQQQQPGQRSPSGVTSSPPLDKFTFYAKNINCAVCKQDVDGSKELALIYLQNCEHVYHARCAIRHDIGNRPFDCLICMPQAHRVRRSEVHASAPYANASDDDDCYSDDVSSEEEEEKQAFDEEHYREMHADRPISLAQKFALLKGTEKRFKRTFKPSEHFNVTFDILRDGDRTIEDICKADLDLLDLYFTLHVKQWDQLVELDMQKAHLMAKRGGFMPLSQLIDLYDVTYANLTADLDLTVQDAIVLDFSPSEMRRLQVDFDGLLGHGLTKKDMVGLNYTMAQWKELGMGRDHLFQLQFGPSDIRRLNWSLVSMPAAFCLSPADEDSLGITQLLEDQRRCAKIQAKVQVRSVGERRGRARVRARARARAREQERADIPQPARPRGRHRAPATRPRRRDDDDDDDDDPDRRMRVPPGVITL